MQTPPKVPSAARVSVVGTLNVDFIRQMRDLPRPGHTVLAHGAQRELGGKGANQVVVNAAAENLIVVHGGANHLLAAEAVTRALAGLCPASDLLVTQLEGPLDATLAALRFAAVTATP